MAVIDTRSNKSPSTLGILGSLATLAGTATGMGWLTTLGTGMGAVDKAINGETPSTQQAGGLSDILKSIGGWFKPSDGNIGKVEKSDEELAREWSGYMKAEDLARKRGGYGSWANPVGANSWSNGSYIMF